MFAALHVCGLACMALFAGCALGVMQRFLLGSCQSLIALRLIATALALLISCFMCAYAWHITQSCRHAVLARLALVLSALASFMSWERHQ